MYHDVPSTIFYFPTANIYDYLKCLTIRLLIFNHGSYDDSNYSYYMIVAKFATVLVTIMNYRNRNRAVITIGTIEGNIACSGSPTKPGIGRPLGLSYPSPLLNPQFPLRRRQIETSRWMLRFADPYPTTWNFYIWIIAFSRWWIMNEFIQQFDVINMVDTNCPWLDRLIL